MIAAECERHDGLHVTADNLYVELVANGQLCEPGERGEVLLTDLHNYGMPLIRYKVGDVGSWKGRDCACGRGLPLLNVVEGRTLDLISTPSGLPPLDSSGATVMSSRRSSPLAGCNETSPTATRRRSRHASSTGARSSAGV